MNTMDKISIFSQTSVSQPLSEYSQHCKRLLDLLMSVEVRTSSGRHIGIDEALSRVLDAVRGLRGTSKKAMFIGNGGSAAIAGHQAIDWTKNAGVRSVAFNDGPTLTCFGNDYGYEHVFARAVELYGMNGDVLFAISSSGKSPNILNGVESAKKIGCLVFTFGGFSSTAPLLDTGDLNFYVDSNEYGPVEVAHQALLHYITDNLCSDKRG